MPTYDYKCPEGHLDERFHPEADKSKQICSKCKKPMQKAFLSAPAGNTNSVTGGGRKMWQKRGAI
jgi:putative FmdB family regulatory protein